MLLRDNMLTRFAPSPTGYLHVGNVRTALLCYLYAKKSGGKFLLRIDDTDKERSEEKFVDALKEDLEWLGIKWDLFARQSERLESYNSAVEKLKIQGRIYACYESQQELEVKRKMLLSRGKPPIYDRAALKLTDTQKAEFKSAGKQPHWRFLLEDKNIEWDDEIRGHIKFEAKNLSDPIIIRENGEYTYMLPSTVDDVDLGITHVLRGEDHISNTAIQIQIFKALGGKIPAFAHNALIKTKEGKLSKRTGDSNVRQLRDDGIEPMAISSFLAKVGTSDAIDIRMNLDELIAEFDIKKFGKNQTFYEIEDIKRLNVKYIHQLSYDDVKDKLDAKIDEEFWLAVRPNVESLKQVKDWWSICHDKINATNNDPEFIKKAAELLPSGKWDETTWNIWMDAVKKETGKKGKELFMPIRIALTGMEHGPELKVLLPLIGREKVLERLKGNG